jgi:2-iminobutanoate/2-iminopropanoate deaminase
MSTIIHSPDAPAAIGPYSQGIIANGFLFCAGQTPLDPGTMQIIEGDVPLQTERVLANLHAVLKAAGLDWNDVYARVLGDARPARSTVAVAGLPRDARVEIELVAAVRS